MCIRPLETYYLVGIRDNKAADKLAGARHVNWDAGMTSVLPQPSTHPIHGWGGVYEWGTPSMDGDPIRQQPYFNHPIRGQAPISSSLLYILFMCVLRQLPTVGSLNRVTVYGNARVKKITLFCDCYSF
jgi:hypothetical protein